MSNDKLEPKGGDSISKPSDPNIIKGFTSSTPPPKIQTTTPVPPKEKK